MYQKQTFFLAISQAVFVSSGQLLSSTNVSGTRSGQDVCQTGMLSDTWCSRNGGKANTVGVQRNRLAHRTNLISSWPQITARKRILPNERRPPNVGLMLNQRLRHWPNIKPTLGQLLFFSLGFQSR